MVLCGSRFCPRGSSRRCTPQNAIVIEALLRLPNGSELVATDREIVKSVDRYLQNHQGTRGYLKVVDRLNMSSQVDDLASFLSAKTNPSLRVEALR